MPFKQIQRIKELVLNARIVVKTTNVEISRRCLAEDGADSSRVSRCLRGCESSLICHDRSDDELRAGLSRLSLMLNA